MLKKSTGKKYAKKKYGNKYGKKVRKKSRGNKYGGKRYGKKRPGNPNLRLRMCAFSPTGSLISGQKVPLGQETPCAHPREPHFGKRHFR